MSARRSRFSGFGSRRRRGRAAGAVIACAVLLAGCGGSAGSSAESGAPVIRGDAPVAAPATLTVSNTTMTGTVGTPITLTSTGGSSTDTVNYTATTGCTASGALLSATVAGTCDVTATQLVAATQVTQTSMPVTFKFEAVAAAEKTVTFCSNQGSGCGVSRFQKASTTTALSPNTWAIDAHEFDGWAMSKTGIKAYDDKATYPFTANATLYARWVPDRIVKFMANGGSGTMSAQRAHTDEALYGNQFLRSGYTFDGWATSSTGIRAYGEKASYPFVEGVTLYATWVADRIVTFDYNGVGAGGYMEPIKNGSTGSALPLVNFARPGYIFAGWATSPTGSATYANQASYPFGESATLYATWKWHCIRVNLTVSAKRTGAGSANVSFSADAFYPNWTSWVAFAAKDGGKGATLDTTSPNGVITVTGLDKKSGYNFEVKAKNEMGCSYTATTNRILKWGLN